MSEHHKETLARIRREYSDAVTALTFARTAILKGRKDAPVLDPDRLEAAAASANDAYALLLVATAERFLREYLSSGGLTLPKKPGLNNLVDQTRKHFNKAAKQRIRLEDAGAVHDLRLDRNDYAHGYPNARFPGVARVAEVLGRFFTPLP